MQDTGFDSYLTATLKRTFLLAQKQTNKQKTTAHDKGLP